MSDRKMDIVKPKTVPKPEKTSNTDETNQEWSNADDRRAKLRSLLERQRQIDRKHLKPLKIAIIVAAVVVVALAITGIALYNHAQWLSSPAGIAAQQQTRANDLTAKVAKLAELPDEQPIVSLIDDISKLSSQSFFDDAENGDAVLIFETAGRAIIYRETENRIIKDGPLVPTVDAASVEASTTSD
jgi:hypothetical protein